MVQGCTSNAGKSYLASALCRILADEGLRVAPFKAQNMSNNAGVTPAGLEMGRAQLVQARAARVVPDVRMNPVLLKPEADTRSQVVLMGQASAELTNLPWRERKPKLWPHVQDALHSLMDQFDVVVIEGAGSPAEVNLRQSDIVNMRIAREVNAAVLLAADIDRGGAFAHLLGTWHCLVPEEKALLKGFILNRFRGDARLLAPAPQWLEEQTGIPTVGVVPWLDIPLPEEDGVAVERAEGREQRAEGFVAVARLPRISNLDEFAPLGDLVRWVARPEELAGARAVILPGSKSTAADLAWLRSSGLAAGISRLAAQGVPVLGVCGGLQMLGTRITDPHGVESEEEVTGLGLLDIQTQFDPIKTTRQTRATDAETGLVLDGYEIHHGQTVTGAGVQELAPGLLWRQGNVRGTYLHGILENAAYLERFLTWAGLPAPAHLDSLDARLDAIAAQVRASLDWEYVRGLV
ncbi:cobyric acid synthase [Deinococcus radiophilus]|uniref:Cobyric acid synthase n=1 Tax=Deinococcus radiophilus TaxID=32062 RepID=A0A431VPT5_9DEIO|nr:cobyric acid synthase [Deinococcus radiophilus]RTR25210.1 cobyric acid synthase [Deinococcus radiophilus]UFA51910.1 cobyric acid synthase [Deinococcus radiophilus]